MAHELKNALQSMQYSLASLRKRLLQSDPAASEKVLRRLERAVSHMDDVITNIHSAAGASTSRQGQFVSLPSSVETAVELLRGYLEVKDIQVETRFAPKLPLVRGDRVQVEQILIILIKNAAQAMASREERRLTIEVTLEAQRVRLLVTDTGGGLPPEVRARMFEPFVTTKPTGVGIGLGLPTAKRLASNCDVDLSFESQDGVGATFALEFSLSGLPQSEAPQAAALSSSNVLLVGDDATTLESVSATLIAADARVLVATSAAEAIQALRVHLVDVLLCDEAMYPVTASTFVEQAREVYRGPVCLLANQHQPETRRYGNVDCVVPKPVRESELVNAIVALMS
jgi:CheY-like chemotaxis protein